MPRYPVREFKTTPDRFRPIHTITFPKLNEIFFYIGRCRFMKTDRKPRVKIVRIYTYYNPPTYDVELVATGATLYCDLRELVPVDGDYYHFRRLLASN
jgi:hypothetical protein